MIYKFIPPQELVFRQLSELVDLAVYEYTQNIHIR